MNQMSQSNDSVNYIRSNLRLLEKYNVIIQDIDEVRSNILKIVDKLSSKPPSESFKDYNMGILNDIKKERDLLSSLEKNISKLPKPTLKNINNPFVINIHDFNSMRNSLQNRKEFMNTSKLFLRAYAKEKNFTSVDFIPPVIEPSVKPFKSTLKEYIKNLISNEIIIIKTIFEDNLMSSSEDMNIEDDRSSSNDLPFENQKKPISEIHVTLRNILTAYIQIRTSFDQESIEPEHVSILGPKEEHGGPWKTSNLEMFNQITTIANNGINYYLTYYPKDALYCFIIWLTKYSNIFSLKCGICSKYLLDGENGYSLPNVRNFDLGTNEAFHYECLNL